jgi:hypothetical protein
VWQIPVLIPGQVVTPGPPLWVAYASALATVAIAFFGLVQWLKLVSDSRRRARAAKAKLTAEAAELAQDIGFILNPRLEIATLTFVADAAALRTKLIPLEQRFRQMVLETADASLFLGWRILRAFREFQRGAQWLRFATDNAVLGRGAADQNCLTYGYRHLEGSIRRLGWASPQIEWDLPPSRLGRWWILKGMPKAREVLAWIRARWT